MSAMSTVAQEPPFNVVHPVPAQAPPWLPGYQVRWPVRAVGDPVKQTAQTVLVSLPTGGWIKPDVSDIVVVAGDGKPLEHVVLSTDPTGETIIQFKRHGQDAWYWVYGVNAAAPAKPAPKIDAVFHEGVTLEVRAWGAGDDLKTWPIVRAGLDKSTKVIGNAIVGEVMQYTNPARPSQPHQFASSFRGYLDIKKPGNYRFLVNADGASFLFIDGFKVFERPGSNQRLTRLKVDDLDKLAGQVELKAGVHPFEVHCVVGSQPDALGVCGLMWAQPGQPKFTFLTHEDVKQPVYGRVAAIQRPENQSAAAFAFGMDDMLDSSGLKLYLVRFEAQGPFKDTDKLVWDFGDGTTGTGRSLRHVYFKDGDYTVTLQCPGMAPFKRTVHVWAEPGEANPLSLQRAVDLIAAMDWKKQGPARAREIFAFLSVCEQPNRWTLLDQVAEFLLEQGEKSQEFRSQLFAERMEALAQLGKAAEALKLADKVMPEFTKTPVLLVRIQLAQAAIHQYHFKDANAASKIYKAIIDEHRRTEHPFLRLAGIRWGDLFAEAGDLVQAGETYRVAATLGGEKFQGTATTEASTRGALIRIAEQKLREKDINATRHLLQRIELNYPGQRLDGLYCFLRAEADRHAGLYDDSIRNYEMILKLPQWAGYRGRALGGIAQCQLGMGKLDEAHKLFAKIKEAYPKYYDDEKLADAEKLLALRLERKAEAAKDPTGAAFHKYSTGFEPDEAVSFGKPGSFNIVAGNGFHGPHAIMMEVLPPEKNALQIHVKHLQNLTPGMTYWVEVWYKDIMRPVNPGPITNHGFLHFYLSPEKPPPGDVVIGANLMRNTFQWHKLGVKMKAPQAIDFFVKLYFYNQNGIVLYDALTVEPITDRQIDALTRFNQGTAP